ncbi:MAG: hypothetical protein K2F99_02605, partial [Muribaculaceae bacterium]|nr:hypothetical protein [Muribaculaceae bacterium]
IMTIPAMRDSWKLKAKDFSHKMFAKFGRKAEQAHKAKKAKNGQKPDTHKGEKLNTMPKAEKPVVKPDMRVWSVVLGYDQRINTEFAMIVWSDNGTPVVDDVVYPEYIGENRINKIHAEYQADTKAMDLALAGLKDKVTWISYDQGLCTRMAKYASFSDYVTGRVYDQDADAVYTEIGGSAFRKKVLHITSTVFHKDRVHKLNCTNNKCRVE